MCLVVILVIIGSNIVAYDSGARPSEYIHVDRYANNNLIISLTTQVFHISFFFFVSSHFVWGLFFFFCHDRLSSLLCRFHYRVFIITRVHYVVKKSVAGLFFFSQPHLPSFLFRVSSLISWEISSSLPTLSRFHVVVVFCFFSYSCSCTSNTKNDRTEMNKQNDLRPLQNVLVSIKDVQGIVRLLSSNLLHRFEPIVYNDQFTCCIHLCIVGYSVRYWYLFERRESWTIDGTKSLRVRSENVCPSPTEKRRRWKMTKRKRFPPVFVAAPSHYKRLMQNWEHHDGNIPRERENEKENLCNTTPCLFRPTNIRRPFLSAFDEGAVH